MMNKKISRRDFLKLAGVTSAGLALSACGVKATEIPTVTSIPPISTPLPTITSTSAPTPVEQLAQTKQALAEFVQAFKMANVDISVDQVIQKGLEIRTISGKDGNQYDVALVHVENAQLGGDYPLMIKIDGEWVFVEPDILATIKGKLIGLSVAGGDETSNELMYGNRASMFNVILPPAAFSELYMGKNGNPEKWLRMVKKNQQYLIVHALFGKYAIDGTVADESFARERVRKIFQAIKNERIKDFSVVLANEPFWNGYGVYSKWETNNPYYKNMGGEKWIANAYKIVWEVATSNEFQVTPGKDFGVIGLNGFIPLKNSQTEPTNSFYLTQAKRIRQDVANMLSIEPESVPFDLGINMYIGKNAATINRAIPINVVIDPEKTKNEIDSFFADINSQFGEKTRFWVNEFAINSDGASFEQATQVTQSLFPSLIPHIQSLIYYMPLSIDHLGKDSIAYPQFFPNIFFGESPDFNLGAPFFALNAALMNI